VNKIPSNYVLEKFYTYSGSPSYSKFTKTYNASCPVCREGKSWLKKKRLFLYPESDSFYCFNCVKAWNIYTWLYQVSGMTKDEIHQEAFSNDFSREIVLENNKNKFVKKITPLPHDSINLNDLQQKIFYGNDKSFKNALEYIEKRKLNTAVNKSSSYFISLTDNFHKNRLCIPYYDLDKKIVFYQTRALDGSEPRYLNKVGCDKSLFGIERVDSDIEYLFLFEGAIDAMMVKNGLAVVGLTLTEYQKKQLNNFPFHKKIWVLDNLKIDKAAKESTQRLLLEGQTVFRWPDVSYKDFNEWAVKENLNEINYNIILENI